MKLSVCSLLLATLLVASSATEAQDAQSSLARRHHAKMQHDMEKRGIFSGMATWYGWGPSSMGACGGKLPQNGFYVALNGPQYGNMNAQSPMCNKQITITDGKKTTTATILDACPGDGSTCKYGSLDMSKPLFNYFNDFGVGVFNIRWWVTGEGGDGDSNSGSSGNSDNSDSSDSSDNGAAQRAAAKKAQDAKDAKEAAEKAAEEKKEKEAAAAKKAAAKKKAAAEKKKEEAAKKKKAAAEKKKAEKKAAEEKVRNAQHQNIAAFGEIMQTLNQIVESAGGQSADSSSTSSA